MRKMLSPSVSCLSPEERADPRGKRARRLLRVQGKPRPEAHHDAVNLPSVWLDAWFAPHPIRHASRRKLVFVPLDIGPHLILVHEFRSRDLARFLAPLKEKLTNHIFAVSVFLGRGANALRHRQLFLSPPI